MKTISVIVPVLNEEETINESINRLRGLKGGGDVEIIVVDGNPEGRTVRAIADRNVIGMTSSPGRGIQMNAGVTRASGDVFLFLHVDTGLPDCAFQEIARVMETGLFAGGAFDLRIAGKGLAFRVIQRTASRRSRVTRIPYGDQAIFVTRECFFRTGGYKEWPIMEDVDFTRRVKRQGGRICFIDKPVRTSARRWEREGVLKCTLRNWTIMSFYLLGVSPERLARWYR
jgi:rSAM/selenodomain-associated transferase 2